MLMQTAERLALERILEKVESMNGRLKVLASEIACQEREEKEHWQKFFNEVAEVKSRLIIIRGNDERRVVMRDETANQTEIYDAIVSTVDTLNKLLKQAEDAAMSIVVTFPLKSDTARVSVALDSDN